MSLLWPRLPDCYCDPETWKLESSSSASTGWDEGHGGPACFSSPHQSLWASLLLLQLSLGCPLLILLEVETRGSIPRHMCPHEWARPGQHPTLEPSCIHISAVELGQGGPAGLDGVSFYPYPLKPQSSYPESIGGSPAPSRQCQHKPIHPRVEVLKGLQVSWALAFQSPQAWVTAPFPNCPFYNCSGSTEKGLSSNNVL